MNHAGRVLYVVLGACGAEKMSEHHPDVAAVSAGCDAVFDQAGEDDIAVDRRVTILAALEAANNLVADLPRKALVDAACDLEDRLKVGHIHMSDFEKLRAA